MADASKSGKSSGKSGRDGGRRHYFRAKGGAAPEGEESPEPGKGGRVGGQRTSAKRSSAHKSNQRQSTSQNAETKRSDSQPSDPPRSEAARPAGNRADGQRGESTRAEQPRQESSRSRSRRSGSSRGSASRSANERGGNERSGGRGGQHATGGSRQRMADLEARRARRRRRRSSERSETSEIKQEPQVTVSSLDYTAPQSVSIYTYVTRGDFGERYESKVEHFSHIGRNIEDYGIDLSKLIAEDGTIQLPKMNGKITDWESDEPNAASQQDSGSVRQ